MVLKTKEKAIIFVSFFAVITFLLVSQIEERREYRSMAEVAEVNPRCRVVVNIPEATPTPTSVLVPSATLIPTADPGLRDEPTVAPSVTAVPVQSLIGQVCDLELDANDSDVCIKCVTDSEGVATWVWYFDNKRGSEGWCDCCARAGNFCQTSTYVPDDDHQEAQNLVPEDGSLMDKEVHEKYCVSE